MADNHSIHYDVENARRGMGMLCPQCMACRFRLHGSGAAFFCNSSATFVVAISSASCKFSRGLLLAGGETVATRPRFQLQEEIKYDG